MCLHILPSHKNYFKEKCKDNQFTNSHFYHLTILNCINKHGILNTAVHYNIYKLFNTQI